MKEDFPHEPLARSPGDLPAAHAVDGGGQLQATAARPTVSGTGAAQPMMASLDNARAQQLLAFLRNNCKW